MSIMYSRKNDLFIPRSDLSNLEVPKPLGRFHHPIPFSEFVDLVDTSLYDFGFLMLDEEYVIKKDGQRFFGMCEIVPIDDQINTGVFSKNSDWKVTLGLRGSHDQSIPRGLTIGSRVIVCSNLCFHGDLGTFKVKQTLNSFISLQRLIDGALSVLNKKIKDQDDIFLKYKMTQITQDQGDSFLCNIFRRGGFTSHELGIALKEWENPTITDHIEAYGLSVWTLFNACTQALKPTGDSVNMESIRSRSLLVSNTINMLSKNLLS